MKIKESQRLEDIDWHEIIYYGIETQEIDFKAALNWKELPRTHKAKFARHAMALANTRGGYVVIGVGEDENGNPVDYQGLTEEQLRSFDPSIVGQFINLYADPSIDFDIARPEVDGKNYAVLVVRRFSDLPHVSSNHCGEELQQGAFYIRTPDARSRPAYRASELRGIIQRALRNQREALGRMLRGVLYEGRQYAEPDDERQFQDQITLSRNACRKHFGQKKMNEIKILSISAYPEEFIAEKVTLSAIYQAVDNIALPIPGILPLTGSSDHRKFNTNRSFVSESQENSKRFHFFEAFPSGLFNHIISIEMENNQITYTRMIQLLASAMQEIGEFYGNLGIDSNLITFTISLENFNDCELIDVIDNPKRPYKCYIQDITVTKHRTAADLITGVLEHTMKVVREVCERFNFSAEKHFLLREKLNDIFKN